MTKLFTKFKPFYKNLYGASKCGEIIRYGISNKNGYKAKEKILKKSISNGYHIFTISDGPIRKNMTVHEAVLTAFIGARPQGMVINHKDGNKTNNSIDNLEYCTSKYNSAHAVETGLRRKQTNVKLNDFKVLEIRKKFDNGASRRSLAKEYSVSQHCIVNIVTNKGWKHLAPSKYKQNKKDCKNEIIF